MISECCDSYFMEIVSSLCFGQSNHQLEPDLIERLIKAVFTEQGQVQERPDKIPVIHSFLLQLLLEQ